MFLLKFQETALRMITGVKQNIHVLELFMSTKWSFGKGTSLISDIGQN